MISVIVSQLSIKMIAESRPSGLHPEYPTDKPQVDALFESTCQLKACTLAPVRAFFVSRLQADFLFSSGVE